MCAFYTMDINPIFIFYILNRYLEHRVRVHFLGEPTFHRCFHIVFASAVDCVGDWICPCHICLLSLLLCLIRLFILIISIFIFPLRNWMELPITLGPQILNYGLTVKVMLIILPNVFLMLLKMRFLVG